MSHPISEPFILEVTIPSGDAVSDAIHVANSTPKAFHLPTIDNSKLTFLGSADGSTFYNVYDSTNSEVEEPATTGQLYLDAPDALRGVNYVKIRTGTSASPVSQSAERTITVVCK